MKTKPTMGRKLIAWILTLAMVITFIPMTGNAVYAGTATIETDKAVYEVGEPVKVKSTGYTGNNTDWVAIYSANDTDEKIEGTQVTSYFWHYPDGGFWNFFDYDCNHREGMDNYLPEGEYRVVLLTTGGSGYVIKAETKIEIVTPENNGKLTTDKEEYTAGEAINVTAEYTNDLDWVALYEAGKGPWTRGAYSKYYCPKTDGKPFTINDLGAGEYTLYFLENDGYNVLDCVQFTVTAGTTVDPDPEEPEVSSVPTVATDKATYKYGESIFVTTTSTYGYSGTDWVGIYQKGQTPGSATPAISWYYVNEHKDGFDITDFANSHDAAVPAAQQDALFNGKLKAGEYTVYMCLNDSYTVETQTDITIEKEAYGEPEVTPAGCEIAGSSVQWYTDGSKVETEIPALEHNWSEYAYDAETKTHSRTCSTTNHTETGDCEFAVSGEPVVDAAGTTTTYKCSTCGGTYTETVASGFTFVENVTVDATCTTDGETYELWVNDATGEEKKVNHEVIPATGHGWGDWTPVGENATTHERVCANDATHKETEDCTRGEAKYVENRLAKVCSECGSEELVQTVLSMEKDIYGVGEDIIVKVNNPEGNKNWIGIFFHTDGTPYPNKAAKGWTYVTSDTQEFKVNDKSIWEGGAGDKDTFLLDDNTLMPGEWTVAIILDNKDAAGQVVPLMRFKVCDHKWTKENVIEDATCTKEGLKEYTCSTCKEKKTEAIPTLEHSWGAPEFNENQAIYGCDNCDAEKAVAVLTMEKHVYGVGEDIIVKVNNPEGTNNWIGIFYDTDGTPYPDAPAKGWVYVSDTKEFKINDKSIWQDGATDKDKFLLDGGKLMPGEWTVAIVLNDQSAAGQVSPLLRFTVCDHNWNTENIVTKATCTEDGLKELICKCGDKKTETIAKLGHAYDEGTVTTEPTCTEDGVKTFVCANSDACTYTEPVPATGHTTFFVEETDSTCTVPGYYEHYECEDCDLFFDDAEGTASSDNKADYEKNLAPHQTTNVPVKNATCEEDGVAAHSICGTCEGLFVVEGDALVEVTAEELVIDALEHNYVGTVTTEPTCTEAGVKTFVCQNDAKHTYTEPVAAAGHKMTPVAAVAATCEEAGVKAHFVCGTCKGLFEDEAGKVATTAEKIAVAKLGHKWDAGKVTKEATCTEDGVKTFVCQNDAKHTKTEAVKAAGHKYTDVVTAPTCTEDGFTTHTCACGDTYKDAVTTAPGHTVVVDAAVAPTYTATGLTEGSHCSVCEAVLTAQEEVAGLVPAAAKNVKVNLRTVSGGYDDIKATWNKVTGATSYKVYYKKATAKKWTVVKVKTNSYTKAGLSDGVKYQVKVVAVGKFGESKASGIASTTTLKKLSTPKVTKSGTKVKVKWNNIDGETGYQISRSTKKTGTNVVATAKTTKGVSKIVKANKGKKYYYKVRAYKVVNGKKVCGPWSAVKAFKR